MPPVKQKALPLHHNRPLQGYVTGARAKRWLAKHLPPVTEWGAVTRCLGQAFFFLIDPWEVQTLGFGASFLFVVQLVPLCTEKHLRNSLATT